MSPRRFHFLELGRALKRQSESRILMLWAYLDESGLHASRQEGGGLRKFTIGGCIAERHRWDRLTVDWAAAMDLWGIPMFHMAAFEARAKPFDKWTNQERKDRLNQLLEMIGETEAHCYGFTNIIRPDDDTSKIYERCAHDAFLELSMNEDEFSIVFAHHPEYGEQQKLYDKIISHGMRKQVVSCSVEKPMNVEPLQAADLIAYELCRDERDGMIPRRYPINRLFELGCTFRCAASVD